MIFKATEKCTATARRTGKRCGQWPRRGTTVCNAHGARAPQVRAKAAANVAQEEVRMTAAALMKDVVPVNDPLEQLQMLAGRVLAWEEALRERVSMDRLRYTSGLGTEQIRAEVQLLTAALRESREVLATIAKLNIDERLIAIEKGKADMVFRALQAGLVAVGVTGPAQTAALQAAGKELRLIKGGQAGY